MPTVLQPPLRRNASGLGWCAFARHYLRNHFCFLFLRVLRCFSSPGSPHTWCDTKIALSGLPHSEIHASQSICLLAWLIAACHVLLRLREPRHPSCALLSFPFSFWKSRLFYAFFRRCRYLLSLAFCRFVFRIFAFYDLLVLLSFCLSLLRRHRYAPCNGVVSG